MADAAEFQWTTYAAVLGLGLVGYVGYSVFPAFSDNIDATQQIHAVVNDGWRKVGKEELHKRVLEKLSAIGSHMETPAGGLAQEVRGLPVSDDDITIVCTDTDGDCSDQKGDVTISVQYTRHMPLPGLKGKFVTLHFSPSAKATLVAPTW